MVHTSNGNKTQFLVLPPSRQAASRVFRKVETNNRRHEELLAQLQRFRGRIYAQDGAVAAHDLTSDGRHVLPIDDQSWHVLSLDPDGRICACLRYLEENRAVGFDDLWVRHSAVSHSPLAPQFRRAVEGEMSRARQQRLSFGEVGGWAVAESHRRTMEPLRIILATYGLLELLGGSVGVATATFRHSSATILRRIGLSSLAHDGSQLPPYYDPNYRCEMELLRFDSRFPNPKYREWVVELSEALVEAPVISRDNFRARFDNMLRGFEAPAADPCFAA